MEPGPDDRAQRFSAMYERWYGAVYAYAARRVGGERADEIAAETFLIAWRRFGAVPAPELPWLYGVARNVIMRARTAQARDAATVAAVAVEASRPTWSADADPVVVAAAALGNDPALEAAWERLSWRDREVLALIAWEELSVAAAAAALGCSPSVFSVRLHRARKRLARLLAAGEGARSAELSEVRS